MPVTNLVTDVDAWTLTITAEFAAPVERVWAIYADPAQLALVWGPPTHPATFLAHSLSVGGRMNYVVTGPDGAKDAGLWQVTAVDEPHRFAFDEGFADLDFTPKPDLPVSHNVFTFEPIPGGTRVSYLSRYETAEGLQTMLDMGLPEGATAAINQVDALLSPRP